MTFYPASDEELRTMLDAIGVKDFGELIANIPEEVRLRGSLNLPPKLSEFEAVKELQRLAEMNIAGSKINFMGGGSYDHFVPTVIAAITGRSEYYTAYTPYQAEVSQGTLQAIYEYQSMICRLTGMDVSNASMYDGGSALAEACLLAAAYTGKKEIVMAGKVHPDYVRVVDTYCRNQEINITTAGSVAGSADIDALQAAVTEKTAAVVVQQPNFYGCLEDVFSIGEIAKSRGALYITVINPLSLGILAPPGDYGADITVGEGQPLGLGLNFGGPYLGIFAVREFLMRKIPGRLAGITTDVEGNRGFVLTLQTREQQIRREKATSNICTNQGLTMLAATVYMAALGKQGLKEIASLCIQKSHYLAKKLRQIEKISIKFDKPFFNEFVVSLPIPAKILVERLVRHDILAGVPLSNWSESDHDLLVAVTEKRTKREMDTFAEKLEQSLTA
jgi:glycine dehydrogenase subunit 1